MCWRWGIPVFFFLAQFSADSSRADVTVPSIFSDHAVLQRRMEVPVWGTASPGEIVTVEFDGQTNGKPADANGHWIVRLAPMLRERYGD